LSFQQYEEDNCYLGSALGLIEHGCHGNNEIDVFKQLCVVVDEWIYKKLPVPIGQNQTAIFYRKPDLLPSNQI